MKQFIKDGKIAGAMVIIDGRQVFSPSEEILLEAGYKEYTPEYAQAYKERHATNDDIAQWRAEAYRNRSDSLYIAYQKYLAQGKEDKAEEMKAKWLDEVERIELEFPYKEDK